MIFEKVAKLLAEQFGLEVEEITEDMGMDDLGADSVDLVELSMNLEEEFDIEEMSEEDIASIHTVGDLVGYLRSSYANENRGGLGSNERLEFLGDSILGMVTADHLYHAHPDLPEGDLTRTRAALVCEESLVEVADRLELGKFLRLGRGEAAGGGRERPSIRADAVEAVLAAVYLDGGLAEARKIVQRFILARETEKAVTRDYKTALQELVQRESGQVLAYRLIGQSAVEMLNK